MRYADGGGLTALQRRLGTGAWAGRGHVRPGSGLDRDRRPPAGDPEIRPVLAASLEQRGASGAQGAWTVFEDEAGQTLLPPRARTWGRRGHTPVVRVSGKGLGPGLDRRAAGLPARTPCAPVLPVRGAPGSAGGTAQPVRSR